MLSVLFSLVFLIPLFLFEGFWWLVQSFLFSIYFILFFCFPYFLLGKSWLYISLWLCFFWFNFIKFLDLCYDSLSESECLSL